MAPRHKIRQLLLGCLMLTITGCLPSEEIDSVSKIIYGLTADVGGIDLHIHPSAETGIIARQVYDTLVYRHPQTRDFVPGLAQAWSIAENRLEYTFQLRSDVTFHDGTPFDADAVAANFERILISQVSAIEVRRLLGPIQSYQVVDAMTFRIVLNQPYEPLLDSLSQPFMGIASPTALTEFSEQPLRYQYHQVGTGPFEFYEYLPQDRVVIRRSENYAWHPDFYATVPDINVIDEIEFRFFSDADERIQALESDAAQIIEDLSPTDARNIANDDDITLVPITIPGQPLQFYFNTQQPPTDSLAIRQALLFGINRTAIVDAVYQGFALTAWGSLSRDTLYYNSGVENVYAYNLEQAQSLLQASGYTDSNNDGFLERSGEVLTITIIQPPNDLLPDVVQALQTQWELLGVQVVIEPVPGYSVLLERINNDEYNLVPFGENGLDPIFMNRSLLSTEAFNYILGYEDVELDSMLIEAMQSPDRETRRILYGQIQGVTLQEALILPIREQVKLNAHTTAVQNLTYDAYGLYPLLYNLRLAQGTNG